MAGGLRPTSFEALAPELGSHAPLAPEPLHQRDLRVHALPARVEVLAQRLVLERIPAHSEPEPQPATGEHVDLRSLLGGERGLPLRQDDDAGDELDRPRARGNEPEQHERLVKRLRGVVVLADHVVERDDVLEALVLGRRRELPDRARIVADLVLGEDDADLHDRHRVTHAVLCSLTQDLLPRLAHGSRSPRSARRRPRC